METGVASTATATTRGWPGSTGWTSSRHRTAGRRAAPRPSLFQRLREPPAATLAAEVTETVEEGNIHAKAAPALHFRKVRMRGDPVEAHLPHPLARRLAEEVGDEPDRPQLPNESRAGRELHGARHDLCRGPWNLGEARRLRLDEHDVRRLAAIDDGVDRRVAEEPAIPVELAAHFDRAEQERHRARRANRVHVELQTNEDLGLPRLNERHF